MRNRKILILGGTGDALKLAKVLIATGYDVITSLAGVTQAPRLPEGHIRRGGFGGADGMADYLMSEGIAAVVDATHPYAAQISRHAAQAAKACGLYYARIERPAWREEPGDRWIHVATVADAVSALPSGARALATIGRKEIAGFFAREDISGVARMIERPAVDVPSRWTLVLARPPFALPEELKLIEDHSITHLVAKNSGGDETRAKIIAAREKAIPVIMIARPPKPEAPAFSSAEMLLPPFKRALSP